jgi:ATP-binding cassette subfamily F protein uup
MPASCSSLKQRMSGPTGAAWIIERTGTPGVEARRRDDGEQTLTLLSVNQLDYSVGGPLLLEQASFAVSRGERICILGRNGAGKSTLLRLLAGQAQPDAGNITCSAGVRVALLQQEVPHDLSGNLYDLLAHGAGALGDLLAEYDHATHAQEFDADRVQALHEAIDAQQGWSLDARIRTTLQRSELDGELRFENLSGGMKRRALLARALVSQPDVLLLDEPTNHLDLPAIEWLEGLIAGFDGAILFVTHDRRLIRQAATRILEIDRGKLTSWPGDYANYLRRRAEREHAEALAEQAQDRKLAAEEVWIRQGIKARRTRNEGRVRALQALRRERAQRRERQGVVKAKAMLADPSGRRVFELKEVGYSVAGRDILQPFSLRIMRGDKVGLIGRNGAGKSTLIRLLLGELQPSTGTVEAGSGVTVAYFDQQRVQLREDWNALDNVSEGAEFIETPAGRKHALGYLQDFLFTPERARAPITMLSGGERNRLLLAKLLARPSNVLVMDEPTNDLDVETLELLEEMLVSYTGTLIVVSHDRELLDEVATSIVAISDRGEVSEWVGGYSDWRSQSAPPAAAEAASPTVRAPEPAPPPQAAPRPAARKLSYKEQRELEQLPNLISELEAAMAELQARLGDPAIYRDGAAAAARCQRELAAAQARLEAAYARWETLESATTTPTA